MAKMPLMLIQYTLKIIKLAKILAPNWYLVLDILPLSVKMTKP